jgi:peptidoglycan/xylan/chitin deacetylase (PgdA/CDA1 family)
MPRLSDTKADIYQADRSLWGKARRRLAKLSHRRKAQLSGLKKPMITLSFDDAPSSAALYGRKLMGDYGIAATYFISGGLMGQDSHFGPYAHCDEVMDLHIMGHEIACHTYSHLDCGTTYRAKIEANMAQNKAAFFDMGLPQAQTFAYPYGEISMTAKAITRSKFKVARALHKEIIRTGSDLNQLPAIGIEGHKPIDYYLYWLEKAAQHPASWIVFYSHDVSDSPSDFGTSPEILERLIKAGQTLDFDFVTLKGGADRALKTP